MAAQPKSKADRDAFFEALVADPEKFRKEWNAKAKAENPGLTDEQLAASWDQVAQQFGL